MSFCQLSTTIRNLQNSYWIRLLCQREFLKFNHCCIFISIFFCVHGASDSTEEVQYCIEFGLRSFKVNREKSKSPLCLWSLLVTYSSSIGTCIQLHENNCFVDSVQWSLSSYLLYPIFSFPFEHFHFLPRILGSESMLCIFLEDHIHSLACLAGTCQADYLIVICYFLFSRGLNFKIFFVPGAGLHETSKIIVVHLSVWVEIYPEFKVLRWKY